MVTNENKDIIAFCGDCGAKIEGMNVAFCGDCGSPVAVDKSDKAFMSESTSTTKASSPYTNSVQSTYTPTSTVPQKERKSSLNIGIIAVLSVCVLLLTIGLFFAIRSTDGRGDITSPSVLAPLESEQASTPEPLHTTEPQSETVVYSLEVFHENEVLTEISMNENDTIQLTAVVDYSGNELDITWESSDQQIFNIVSESADGTEAWLVALSQGDATLIVTPGDMIFTYSIRVTDNFINENESIDSSDDSLHIQLYDAIFNTNDEITLTILWFNSERTVFERAQNSSSWMMQGRRGDDREVFPTFRDEDQALTIAWERTSDTRLYFLYGDGTGKFGNRDGTRTEELQWELATNAS